MANKEFKTCKDCGKKYKYLILGLCDDCCYLENMRKLTQVKIGNGFMKIKVGPREQPEEFK